MYPLFISLPMITSLKTTIQYHNQGRVKIENISITILSLCSHILLLLGNHLSVLHFSNLCADLYMDMFPFSWVKTGVELLSHVLSICLLFFLQHIEVPKLGVKSDLQLPAYTKAPATQDPSWVCSLHHSSWQHQILNAPSKVRDWTHNLMVH